MDKKLIDLATQAGFPLNENNQSSDTFAVKKKFGLFGYEEIGLDNNLEKFAELLFDEFINEWWVARNKFKVQKPWNSND